MGYRYFLFIVFFVCFVFIIVLVVKEFFFKYIYINCFFLVEENYFEKRILVKKFEYVVYKVGDLICRLFGECFFCLKDEVGLEFFISDMFIYFGLFNYIFIV